MTLAGSGFRLLSAAATDWILAPNSGGLICAGESTTVGLRWAFTVGCWPRRSLLTGALV